MTYFVKVPKDERLVQEIAKFPCYKKVFEDDKVVVFEGTADVAMPRWVFKVDDKEFMKLYRSIRVENGFKRLTDMGIELTQARRKILTVRLSEEELQLLREDAERMGLPASTWARNLVMSLVREYLALEAQKKTLRETDAICKGCVYWVDYACQNKEVTKEYLKQLWGKKAGECKYKALRKKRVTSE